MHAKENPQHELSDNALYEASIILFDQKDFARSLELSKKVTKDYPSSDVLAESFQIVGEISLLQKQFSTAEKSFNSITQLKDLNDTLSINALFQKAWSLYKNKNYNEAAEVFQQFANKYPSSEKTADAIFGLANQIFNRKNITKQSIIKKIYLQNFQTQTETMTRFSQLLGLILSNKNLTKPPMDL